MIKNMLMFRFDPEATTSERGAVVAELNALQARYPAMRNWSLGENISKRDQAFTHGFSVEFGNGQELRDYLGSEHHEAFARLRFRPTVASRAIASHVCR